ncbi:MAG TPA: 30S ribosomal protein S16 [Candidatus Ornithospirochaeta stercorigallinarum]|nr:30S ribosomal protein S16 [Candidatus Ornithospirochaeta stercorigallinarum]
MSTTMRLKRFGSKKRPYYRVVVMDNRRASTSITIDEVGTYQPLNPSEQVKLDAEKVKSWIQKGVTVSPTVKNLLNSQGINLSRKED